MVTGGYVTEDWGGSYPRHRTSWQVKVSGPDAYVETERRRAIPGERIQVWRLCRIDITWEWSDPNEEDAPGKPFVTLHTEGRDGRPDGGKLFMDQLWRVPTWLADMITRSMPRL